ncbi:MAG TPA: NAD-dependent epimerase/dehydratase family protein [Solirubrobacterales bacterium]|jgi:nucleoside-diphosphate-sugar epimerase|nr:NAD-dependent epimerase/dehydratase family protein [Solirubrobacterales bacterium]
MAEAEQMVLVTGGSGFLGGWCVAELLARGHGVRTTVRDASREAELRARVEKLAGGLAADAEERLSVVVADLEGDAGWKDAVAGCEYVLHVASPFPLVQPKDPDELIVPAREGTLRVLRAAFGAGASRVVVTSSVAAVGGSAEGSGRTLEESDWTDLGDPTLTPYARSKTIAERAAWDLAAEMDATDRLAVVNPGAILGPVEGEDRSPSLEVVQRLLKGMPGVPRIGFNLVDVRDVADLQIRAMADPAAAGKRFVAVRSFEWMADVARILREQLGEEAAKVPSRRVPDLMVRAMGIFDPGVRSITGQLGRRQDYSSARAQELLGWTPRPIAETIVDCARSMAGSGG